MSCFDDGRTLCRLLFSGSPGRETPPRSAASASRAASAAGQSLSAKREQGVPGGAADYHKILNESPWVVPSFRNKAPSRASPAPSGTRYRSSLAQSKDHAQPASRAVRRQSWSGDSPLLGCLSLPRWRIPPPSGGGPLPCTASVPSPCLSAPPKPGRSPPSLVSPPPLFILQPSLASRHLRPSFRPGPHPLLSPFPSHGLLPQIRSPVPTQLPGFVFCFCSNPGLRPPLVPFAAKSPASSPQAPGASTSLAHQDRCCVADLATGLLRRDLGPRR